MARKHRLRNAALTTAGILGIGLVAFYKWQPWEYDFIPRRIPNPNPRVDPDSAHLFAPGTRVAVVTAHPDDAEFYVGGTLTKLHEAGAVLSLVVCTDGDKGYYPFEDAARNRRVRRAETLAAAKKWGAVDVVFLGHPDGRLRNDATLVAQIAENLNRLQPEYVLCFDGDFPPRRSHQDHRRAGEAAALAIRSVPSVKWRLEFSTIAANYYVDITKAWPNKQDLMRTHASQFVEPRHDIFNRLVGREGDPWPFIRNMVGGSAHEDGKAIGVEYAEGLRAVRV